MPPTTPAARVLPAAAPPIHDELRALLGEFLAQHELLLRLTTEHHEAIRQPTRSAATA